MTDLRPQIDQITESASHLARVRAGARDWTDQGRQALDREVLDVLAEASAVFENGLEEASASLVRSATSLRE